MISFVEHTFNGKYTVRVPAEIVPELPASPFHPGRLDSMSALLAPGDTYFDIGTEMGWLAPIFAKMVGAANMCLFEPSARMWPNIRAVWEANGLGKPKSLYWGFVGDINRVQVGALYGDDGWPGYLVHGDRPPLISPQYATIKDFPTFPVTTLDWFIQRTGIVPRGIGMNIEGAEAIVLRGGRETFKQHRPLVWVGMHVNSGALAEYGVTQEELIDFMKDCGYTVEFLGVSYEHWWLFR